MDKGKYEEILNTDKDVYGGNNQYNGMWCEAFEGGAEYKPYHITIKLASYGACIFRLHRPEPEKKEEAPVEKKKRTTKKA